LIFCYTLLFICIFKEKSSIFHVFWKTIHTSNIFSNNINDLNNNFSQYILKNKGYFLDLIKSGEYGNIHPANINSGFECVICKVLIYFYYFILFLLDSV
jgi:hypothetical protein